MFAAPPVVATEVYTRLPDEMRILDRESPWSLARGSGPLHSFLEGPSFDLDGVKELRASFREPVPEEGHSIEAL